ncbi:MAG TPA: acyl-ACP--UDP-N-acetylglucosamine O-acyltransferase [Candidatus Kapabacteria bacterium]|jgi:UDP-N-acetylglucosamine acyltransferase|nr:acyl-ACP--UDP-N-acetylglucosamine O-acyltransferase [Candidatus Kapabacteria bacterium]
MAVQIHPSAVVSPNAQLGENVVIHQNCFVGDKVTIGDGSVLMAGAYVDGRTTIGSNCRLFPYSIVGTEPQDLKYAGEDTLTIIGDNTVIHEFATIHRGTASTGKTSVGSNCLIMAYCHVAHDCSVGDNVIMSNVAQIAGHVHLEDFVILGAFAKIHQFVTVGKHAMVGADIKVVMDVPPFVLIGRNPPRVEKVNKIGLRRRGFSEDVINELQTFYDTVLFSGFNNKQGIEEFMKNHPQFSDDVQYCIDFIRNSSRGIHR